MNRLEFLQKSACFFKEACKRASGLDVEEARAKRLTLMVRKPIHVGSSSDGGDYIIWVHFTQILPYIYEITADWSCDFAALPTDFFGGDCVVLTAEDLEGMMCLPAENCEEREEEEDF